MTESYDQATAGSPFFRVLPPEVRICILTAAFGGRKIHIQRIQLATPQPQASGNRWNAARESTRQWLGGLLAAMKSNGKSEAAPPPEHREQWLACACSYSHEYDELNDTGTSPMPDACLVDRSGSRRDDGRWVRWSHLKPSEVPPELAVGAMGWLLTCRQAYNEGIKILYASNTFHIRANDLRVFGGFIPRIPKPCLSYVTSLELVLDRDFTSSQEDVTLLQSDTSTSERIIMESTLSRIPILMPGLQRLYLGFGCNTCLLDGCASGVDLHYECTKHLLSLLDTLAWKLSYRGSSCGLELAIPSTPFDCYQDEAFKHWRAHRIAGPAWKTKQNEHFSFYSRMRIFWPARDQRLDSNTLRNEGRGTNVGYWISMSEWDRLGPLGKPGICFS